MLNGDRRWSTTNAEKVGGRQVRVDCFDIWEKEDDMTDYDLLVFDRADNRTESGTNRVPSACADWP
jgi:hypothetical protein